MKDIRLVALPAFDDNYIWLLHDGQDALVVDPGDSRPVAEALGRLHLRLSAILVTHHHGDHVGGLEALRARLAGEVFGPGNEPIPGPLAVVQAGSVIDWNGLRFEVLAVPGHTRGHLAFYCPEAGNLGAVLFCGDTLFAAGCGRLFEGTPAQMFSSLNRLAALPSRTLVCCAHEYTLSNLRFARAVEPANAAIASRTGHCEMLRGRLEPTLPSTIAAELETNPFLRCSEPDVIAAALREGAEDAAPLAVFTALREWKNRFR